MKNQDIVETDEAAHAPHIARGALCNQCPLYGCNQGPVPPELRAGSSLIIIGAYPGKYELKDRKSFNGPIGDAVRISARGSIASLTNTTLCCPPGGDLERYESELKAGVMKPTQACAPRLARDIEESGARVIVGLGVYALEAVASQYHIPVGGKSKLGKRKSHKEIRLAGLLDQRGHPFELPDGRIFVATFLSAYREKHFEHVIDADIKRASLIARRGHIDWSEPAMIYDRPDSPLSVERIEEVLRKLRASGKPIIEDIETNGLELDCLIRCIGFACETSPGHRTIIIIPLHHIGGQPYWAGSNMERVRAAIRCVNDESNVVFHNGVFDTERLIRASLMSSRARLWNDTLLKHKNTRENDCPHKLAFVSTRFSEAPLWKLEVDHKADENEQRDEDLHHYCGLDCDETLTANIGLDQWLERDGTRNQYEIDRRAQRIARDMGSLGHFVHEPTRLEMSAKLHEWLEDLNAKLKTIAGQNFNPNSPAQVSDWLFKVKGHRPSLNTQKRVWESGQAASTGIEALIMLQDELLEHGTDKDTSKFIDALVQQRSIEQLRKLYVDNLKTLNSEFEEYRILHAEFKCGVVPSGRWASSPNLQNWPSRAKLNMKEMLHAPPGHIIVGADYDQLELRIYAAESGDALLLQEFAKGANADPHTLNAASLFAKSSSEEDVRALYDEMMNMKTSGSKAEKGLVKFRRTVAKRFCIAEGELVLTDRGEVPIQDVKLDDKVWDGVEWVSHDGVIYQGEKEVIEYQGLRATTDHKVWLEDGRTCTFGEASERAERIARTGSGRTPIRFMGDDQRSLLERSISKGARTLSELWSRARAGLQQLVHRQVDRLSFVQTNDISEQAGASVAASAYAGSTDTLYEFECQNVETLWRPRNRVPIRNNRSGSLLDNGQRAALGRSELVSGQVGQQRPLRAWKSRHGDSVRECEEPKALSKTKVKVYDILNAGIRRRFTVGRLLVSNCFL